MSRSKIKVIQKCEKLSSREGFQAFGGVVTPKEGTRYLILTPCS